jgi:hypothetical protein
MNCNVWDDPDDFSSLSECCLKKVIFVIQKKKDLYSTTTTATTTTSKYTQRSSSRVDDDENKVEAFVPSLDFVEFTSFDPIQYSPWMPQTTFPDRNAAFELLLKPSPTNWKEPWNSIPSVECI